MLAQCSNVLEAIPIINRLQLDVIFLDIQMPKISGLELVAMPDPDSMPYVVFVTAYDKQAVGTSAESAFDYLLNLLDSQCLAKTIHCLRYGISVNKMYKSLLRLS
ncbi:MAG: response regulator [Candidatus Malihini olakiniferum]